MKCKLILLLALYASTSTVRGQLPVGATLLDPDIVWDPVSVESAAISRDGTLIAYVSRGAIWTCRVTSGPPTKLIDLPDTITAYLSMPEHQLAREMYAYMAQNPNNRPLRELRHQILQLFNLQWTPSQDGVVYTLCRKLEDNSSLAAYQVMHVSLKGDATEVALIKRNFTVTPDSFTSFRVTRDRNHVVVSNFGIPLIWDSTTNKSRATCFDCLIPSSTSERFLGVEIDTRELVLVDEDFRIIRRFGVILDQRRRCDLFWSPDERVAVCRSFRSDMEPLSNHCTAFRVNLETGERSNASKGIEGDRYYFSGRGSEVVRVGITGVPPNGYGDGTYGSYIEITPDGSGGKREIVRFGNPIGEANEWHRQFYPDVLCNSDCTLFAMALPRTKSATAGFHFHLIDRDGNKWPFPFQLTPHFNSPYLPIAFANNDRTIVAHNGTQLFSVPVETIQENKKATDE